MKPPDWLSWPRAIVVSAGAVGAVLLAFGWRIESPGDRQEHAEAVVGELLEFVEGEDDRLTEQAAGMVKMIAPTQARQDSIVTKLDLLIWDRTVERCRRQYEADGFTRDAAYRRCDREHPPPGLER